MSGPTPIIQNSEINRPDVVTSQGGGKNTQLFLTISGQPPGLPASIVADRGKGYSWISVPKAPAVEKAAQAPLVLITAVVGGVVYTFRAWKVAERKNFIYFAVEHWVRRVFKELRGNGVKTIYVLNIAPDNDDPAKYKKKTTPPRLRRKTG